jgi:hypothetical protein
MRTKAISDKERWRKYGQFRIESTILVVESSMALYKKHEAAVRDERSEPSSAIVALEAGSRMVNEVAQKILNGLEEALKTVCPLELNDTILAMKIHV